MEMMWMEISAGLLIVLVFVVCRYERRERVTTDLLRRATATMAMAIADRRAPTTESPVPGQEQLPWV